MSLATLYNYCDEGNVEGVKSELEKGSDPSIHSSYALRTAAQHDKVDVVKLLLQDSRVDPSDFNNYCIKISAMHGNLEIFSLIVSDKRFKYYDDDLHEAYRYALSFRRLNVINYFMNVLCITPAILDDMAIFTTIIEHHYDVIELILTDKQMLKRSLELPTFYINKIKFYIAKELNISVDEVEMLIKSL